MFLSSFYFFRFHFVLLCVLCCAAFFCFVFNFTGFKRSTTIKFNLLAHGNIVANEEKKQKKKHEIQVRNYFWTVHGDRFPLSFFFVVVKITPFQVFSLISLHRQSQLTVSSSRSCCCFSLATVLILNDDLEITTHSTLSQNDAQHSIKSTSNFIYLCKN